MHPLAVVTGTVGDVAKEIRTAGFSTRPVVTAATCLELLELFSTLSIEPTRPVYRSFVEESRPIARSIDLALKAMLSDFVTEHLPNHEIIVGTFVFKGAGGPRIDYHQDWTFTDERHDQCILLWIPLVDVDEHGGTLRVIPGSHVWTDRLRTSSSEREGPSVPHQAAMARAAIPLPLSAGEAVLYSPALIHGSEPNRGQEGRTAVILITVPRDARIVHFQETESRLRGFEVAEDYFTTVDFEHDPPALVPVEPWNVAVTAADFDVPLRPWADDEPALPKGGLPHSKLRTSDALWSSWTSLRSRFRR